MLTNIGKGRGGITRYLMLRVRKNSKCPKNYVWGYVIARYSYFTSD